MQLVEVNKFYPVQLWITSACVINPFSIIIIALTQGEMVISETLPFLWLIALFGLILSFPTFIAIYITYMVMIKWRPTTLVTKVVDPTLLKPRTGKVA